jgi:hypothetical protein
MKIKVAKLNHPFKMDQLNLEKVEVIASMGLTDEQIAVILEISPRTLNYWKKHPAFLQSLKRGKLKADFQITQSLYKKAIGYETLDKSGKRVWMAGDTTAMIFWLKNRQPEKWREKTQLEHLGSIKTGDKLTIRVVHVAAGDSGNGKRKGKPKK